jgi:uncharacterized membrane protein YdfJ with MMPL/SSD domain
MIITYDVDPATPEGISHIEEIRHSAQEAVKGTPLAGSKIYIGGTASTYKDIAEMAHYDLIIAGINTGIIRSMAVSGCGDGCGVVFAFTMASFIFSDLLVLGQIYTTIALGLLFDTLIVRSLMTPSIAALLGRWFWWPVRVRQRPVPQKFGDEDTRQLSLF